MGPMVYYIGLYYAMLIHNASVEAGGAHEGMAALGLMLGPATALTGTLLLTAAGTTAAATMGPIVGIAPVCAWCIFRSMRALKRSIDSPAIQEAA